MIYMTPDDLKAAVKKPSKYRNVKTVVDGITFDSRKEARRYVNLKMAESAGAISDLRRQVRYDLHAIGGVKLWVYVADFAYVQDGESIVEDVKSAITRKQPVYVVKRRHMLLEYGIEIREW